MGIFRTNSPQQPLIIDTHQDAMLINAAGYGVTQDHGRVLIKYTYALLQILRSEDIIICRPLKVLSRGQLKDEVKILRSPDIFCITKIANSSVFYCVLSANLFSSVSGCIIRDHYLEI